MNTSQSNSDTQTDHCRDCLHFTEISADTLEWYGGGRPDEDELGLCDLPTFMAKSGEVACAGGRDACLGFEKRPKENQLNF